MAREEAIVLAGVVTPFDGNGRGFGYPTANIVTDTKARDGVYFGYATLNRYSRHPSLIFVGTPTTVGSTKRRVEAHLLDIPDIDYYGQDLSLELIHYHRENKTFPTVESLLSVMNADEIAGRAWFKTHPA